FLEISGTFPPTDKLTEPKSKVFLGTGAQLKTMVDLLIKGAKYVVTLDSKRRVIRDGAVAIAGMKIVDVGKSSELKRKYPRVETIDAKDKLVMPGLFDCHAHSYQNMIRGMAFVLPRRKRGSFLLAPTLHMQGVYTPEDAKASMALNCLEYIKSGIIGFCDWGINLRYKIDGLAEIVDGSGIRGVLGKSVMEYPDYGSYKNVIDKGLVEDKGECIQDTVRAIKKWHGKADGRIQIWFGPRSVGALAVETYKEIARLVRQYKVGITFHLAELGEIDTGHIWNTYGMSPMEFMRSVGWVGPNVSFNHCEFLTGIDLKILMETGTNVAHCPGVGFDTKVQDMLQMGINVALGNDGGHHVNDIFLAMKLENTLQNRIPRRDLTILYPEKLVEMATINGAKALMWERETGSIEKGKKADMIIVDLNRPSLVPMLNPVNDIPARVLGSDVNTVMVNGKILMENRVVKTMDEANVIAEANRRAEEVKERSGYKVEWHWPQI
ncbi:MAG: amidohydrolase, partial [Methanobacteriota archaeon]